MCTSSNRDSIHNNNLSYMISKCNKRIYNNSWLFLKRNSNRTNNILLVSNNITNSYIKNINNTNT